MLTDMTLHDDGGVTPINAVHAELLGRLAAGEFDGAYTLHQPDHDAIISEALWWAAVLVNPAEDLAGYITAARQQLAARLGC